MNIYTKKTIEIEETVDILCNLCGKSLKSENNYEGLIEAELNCGYGSILGDGNRYRFSLCETCLSTIFSVFKHSPKVGTTDISYYNQND